MRKLIYGMNVTLDGYIAAAGDDIGWSGAERRAVPVVDRPGAGEWPVAVRAQAVGDDELLLAYR